MVDKREMYRDGESWKTGSAAKRERMERYVGWFLTPTDVRDPSTKKEFAAMLGVTVQTLANYENDPWFRKELSERAKRSFKVSRWLDVVETLYNIATDESSKNVVSAARLLKEWMEEAEKGEEADFSGLSMEQLEAMIDSE